LVDHLVPAMCLNPAARTIEPFAEGALRLYE
jgi:hypothetical protein